MYLRGLIRWARPNTTEELSITADLSHGAFAIAPSHGRSK